MAVFARMQVGAEVGVGLSEGHLKGTNWRLFGKTACGWIMTLVVAGFISAALFALGEGELERECLNTQLNAHF